MQNLVDIRNLLAARHFKREKNYTVFFYLGYIEVYLT